MPKSITQSEVDKIEPYTARWEREACELARSFTPPIYPCVKCNHPVITGYACVYCKTFEPYGGD